MILNQSGAPHIHAKASTQKTMLCVILSLLPCAAAGIYHFGVSALLTMIVSIAAAIVAEFLWQVIARKKVTVWDFSAVVTGLLLALCITPAAPLWMPAVGSFFAIIVVKQLFGGMGDNFLNPALSARAMLLACWPAAMTTFRNADAITSATPLHVGGSYIDLLVGKGGGSIGETCAIAIALGFIILLVTRTIRWEIPVITIASAALMSLILGMDPIAALLSGGILFGAVFMATDYVTAPMKRSAQVLYAIGIGIITMLIRKYSKFPEGVTYAILIMNAAAPLLDKWMPEKVYGYGVKK